MSGIEWTEATWNPVTGCDQVSEGCDHCYALAMAKRLKAMGAAKYQRDGRPATSGPGFGVTIHPESLEIPLHWRSPRRVFVNSMSDLFHRDVPDDFIARVWAIMSSAAAHTFQILTKRPARMRSLLGAEEFWQDVTEYAAQLMTTPPGRWQHRPDHGLQHGALSNVWLGVSAEDQRWADNRVPALLDTPAAVRFVSAEPLLGPIDLAAYLPALDWLIVGGESGPNARPIDPDWVRTLRDQCTKTGTAFFFKQWGGRTPKAAGRTLDDQLWSQYPTPVHAS